MEKRGGFSRASGATTLKALSMVVVLIFVSFVNCDLCLLLLIVLYYCRSGRSVRLLAIFFWSFVIFLAVFVLLALVTNDRHLWIFVVFLLPVKKSLITAATHPSNFPFVFSR